MTGQLMLRHCSKVFRSFLILALRLGIMKAKSCRLAADWQMGVESGVLEDGETPERIAFAQNYARLGSFIRNLRSSKIDSEQSVKGFTSPSET